MDITDRNTESQKGRCDSPNIFEFKTASSLYEWTKARFAMLRIEPLRLTCQPINTWLLAVDLHFTPCLRVNLYDPCFTRIGEQCVRLKLDLRC